MEGGAELGELELTQINMMVSVQTLAGRSRADCMGGWGSCWFARGAGAGEEVSKVGVKKK